MSQVTDNLRARWPKGAADDLERQFLDIVNLIEAPARKREEFEKQRRFTPNGIAEEIRKHARANYVSTLQRASKTVEDGKAALERRRAEFGLAKPDPKDVVAAAHRREARDFLRTLSLNQRQNVLMQGEPLLVQAALELPDILSGITPAIRQEVQERFVQTHFQDELAAIEQRKEAIDALRAATSIAITQLQQYSGLPNNRTYDADGQPVLMFSEWFDGMSEVPKMPQRAA